MLCKSCKKLKGKDEDFDDNYIVKVRLFYFLVWSNEKENQDSNGDLLFVIEEDCRKLNLLTEVDEERHQ